jgi:hypothetical protein
VTPYVCPNGHPMPDVVTLPCTDDECDAQVVYEPTAHGLELWRALRRAHDLLDLEQGHTTETWTDRERWRGAP